MGTSTELTKIQAKLLKLIENGGTLRENKELKSYVELLVKELETANTTIKELNDFYDHRPDS